MSDSTSVADRGELPIILGEPHMVGVQAVSRHPIVPAKTDSQARCLNCDWQSPQYRTHTRAFRDADQHERETAQAAYGSLKRHHALLKDELAWAVEWMERYEGEVMPEWREWQARGRVALTAAAPPAASQGEVQP